MAGRIQQEFPVNFPVSREFGAETGSQLKVSKFAKRERPNSSNDILRTNDYCACESWRTTRNIPCPGVSTFFGSNFVFAAWTDCQVGP